MGIRMIAVDLDGTLLGADGRVGPGNQAALLAAQQAGIVIAIATGRRHCYAMRVLRELGLHDDTLVVSSNGAVVRNFASTLIERTLMPLSSAKWLVGLLDAFRNALVITFDRVGPGGEDSKGALVVEEFDALHESIGHWMINNERYIEHVRPIEDSLHADPPIQMMLCGTVEHMRRAEALMIAYPEVAAVGDTRADGLISLNRTEYPARDLSIVDILPAGCSKGAALLRVASARGFGGNDIMAIGDNWNDLSMLEIAGYPILMGNAPDDLKEIANDRGWLTTSSHDADGVAEAIATSLPDLDFGVLRLTVGVGTRSK